MKYSKFILILFPLFIGIIIGISLDKEWLSNEQMAYMKNLQNERSLLENERQMWLSYVSTELKPLDIYVASQEEQYSAITKILEPLGIRATKVETFDTMLEKEGILITLGQELEIDANLHQLALEMIPEDMLSAQQFYLSLLRLKGEKVDGES